VCSLVNHPVIFSDALVEPMRRSKHEMNRRVRKRPPKELILRRKVPRAYAAEHVRAIPNGQSVSKYVNPESETESRKYSCASRVHGVSTILQPVSFHACEAKSQKVLCP